MPDQAQGLRVLARQTRHGSELDHSAVVSSRPPARTIVVTSGKGGVGKTNLTTNLAIQLARGPHRVLVLDADLGLANMHLLLGLQPRYSLDHVLRGERRLRDVVTEGPGGLRMVAGAVCLSEALTLSDQRRDALQRRLAGLSSLADLVLIDTGAGLSENVRSFLVAADELVVVTTPEPTAIADAYATIKTVRKENPAAGIRLLLNMVSDGAEAAAASQRLRHICKRFLALDLETVGFVPRDSAVPAAVRAQQPFILASPDSPAAIAVRGIADKLISGCGALIHQGPAGTRALMNQGPTSGV